MESVIRQHALSVREHVGRCPCPEDDRTFRGGARCAPRSDGLDIEDLRIFSGAKCWAFSLMAWNSVAAVLFVDQSFFDDGVDHGAQQCYIGAGCCSIWSASWSWRVHDNKVSHRAGALYVGRGHRMVQVQARADNFSQSGSFAAVNGAVTARVTPSISAATDDA